MAGEQRNPGVLRLYQLWALPDPSNDLSHLRQSHGKILAVVAALGRTLWPDRAPVCRCQRDCNWLGVSFAGIL